MRRLAMLLLAAALGACAAPPPPPARPVMKCPTVPALRQSNAPLPAPPGGREALTLVPGHWDWAGMDYDWVPPSWQPRAKGTVWQDGFWTASGIACFWTPGRLVH